MWELTQAIPDVEVLLALEPEELAAKIIFLARKRGGFMTTLNNFRLELWPQSFTTQSVYPLNRREEVNQAISEAWAWLEAQGLIVPAPDSNGSAGFRVLSRRAKRFESESEFADYAVARMLPRAVLHPKIADKVWMAYMRGEFDVAAFQAMKAVEVAVRDASGLPESLIGVKLMQEAFRDNGPLADMTAESGERQGRIQLFCGAIGSYKNPHSHRDVNLNDPAEAVEIILLANHLLRIVDARSTASRGL